MRVISNPLESANESNHPAGTQRFPIFVFMLPLVASSSFAMLPLIASSSFALVVGPGGAHVASFSRINCADITTFQQTPAHHTDGAFHTTAAHHPAGDSYTHKQRDPTCLLAAGFASENYGGHDRLSNKAAGAIKAAPAGYLDPQAMGTGCAESHGCFLDYDDDEPKVMSIDTDARKATVKAKRDQAAQLLAEADALEAVPASAEGKQPAAMEAAYAWM